MNYTIFVIDFKKLIGGLLQNDKTIKFKTLKNRTFIVGG